VAKLCANCVLPEFEEDIRLDEDGVCNLCRSHEEGASPTGVDEMLETDFVRLLDRYRGKGTYDCLVMCSGGKDSTASLYLMKRRYHMSPLAFTFDLGFETEDALANVRRAADILGVDHVTHRSGLMKRLFLRAIESGSRAVLCHLCSIFYMQLTFETARRYDTPLIIAGWTKGQVARRGESSSGRYGSNVSEYAAMARETRQFLTDLKADPEFADFPLTMEEAIKRGNRRFRCDVQSPHWYLPEAAEEHVPVLKAELGWKPAKRSYPEGSTNCALNFLSSARSLEHYGYTHYHVEMSKLIRQGLMTREEALERLRPNYDEELLTDIRAQLEGPGA